MIDDSNHDSAVKRLYALNLYLHHVEQFLSTRNNYIDTISTKRKFQFFLNYTIVFHFQIAMHINSTRISLSLHDSVTACCISFNCAVCTLCTCSIVVGV